PYWPSTRSISFFEFRVAHTLFPYSIESLRYFTSSALLFAGDGPPFSQCSGGVFPSISLKNAKLAQATCLTCSAKERMPTKFPPGAFGTQSYFSAGIASATDKN